MNSKAPVLVMIAYLFSSGILVSTLTSCAWSDRKEELDKPLAGFVPDAETAKRIAEAVWIPIYGAEEIKDQMPLRATLKGNTWIVEGSLRSVGGSGFVFGGVALVEIAKDDGRIIRVTHGE